MTGQNVVWSRVPRFAGCGAQMVAVSNNIGPVLTTIPLKTGLGAFKNSVVFWLEVCP